MTVLQTALGTVSNPTRVVVTSPNNDIAFLPVLKWGLLLFFLIYVVFAFIITRQITVMKNTLSTNFSPVLQMLGYVHLAVALVIFLIFFIAL